MVRYQAPMTISTGYISTWILIVSIFRSSINLWLIKLMLFLESSGFACCWNTCSKLIILEAFALLLLEYMDLNLKAVTVVYRDVESRARLASKLVSTMSLKTPVALGSSRSILGVTPTRKRVRRRLWTKNAGPLGFEPRVSGSEGRRLYPGLATGPM